MYIHSNKVTDINNKNNSNNNNNNFFNLGRNIFFSALSGPATQHIVCLSFCQKKSNQILEVSH